MSSHRLELRLPANERDLARAASARDYDDELAAFVVSGFGQDRWPTRIEPYLCMFLADLPLVARALDDAKPTFEIAFIEQGCGRILTFEQRGEALAVTCGSMDAWQPSPREESISVRELEAMLREIVERFTSFASTHDPHAAKHRWFETWKSSLDFFVTTGLESR